MVAIKIDKKATGVWAKSGMGYCLRCGEYLDEADFESFDFDGDIVCDNCGQDTEEK